MPHVSVPESQVGYPSPAFDDTGAPVAAAPAPAVAPVAVRAPTAGGGNTVAIRNNNPGNITASATTMRFPGVVGTETVGSRTFLTFDSPDSGYAGMERLLQSPNYVNLPFDAAMRRWTTGTTAPTFDAQGRPVGYDLPAMAGRLGIDRGQSIASLSDAQRGALVREMSVREGFARRATPQPAGIAAMPAAASAVAPPGMFARIFAPASAEAAEVPAGAAVAPAPGAPPALPGPIVVKPHVAAAPLPALQPPPGPVAAPQIPRDPATGYPVAGRTQEFRGGITETYREPTRGDFEQQLVAQMFGITDPLLITDPRVVTSYFNWKQGIDDQAKIHTADIQRMYQPTSPSNIAQLERLNQIQATIEHISQTYTPEQIDYYVGLLRYPEHIIQQNLGVPWADKIAQFRTDIAPIAPTTFEEDAKNNTLSGTELSNLSPLALNPRDDASQFRTNLQGLYDNVRRALAFRNFIQSVPPDQVSSPDVLRNFNADFDRQLEQERQALAQGVRPGLLRTPAAAPSPPTPPAAPPPAVASPRSSVWAPTSTWTVQ